MSSENDGNIQAMARIVFGEARGESPKGQLAVAYVIVNRTHHQAFPNSIRGVVYESGQFETLSRSDHDANWGDAKSRRTSDYRSAVDASINALNGRKSDPTGGAVCFATSPSNPAVTGNQYWRAVGMTQIGGHYFVRLVPNN